MDFYLTINGKKYPARHTLRTSFLAAERRGSLTEMLRGGRKDQAAFLSDMAWLAAEQLRSSARHKAELEGTEVEETLTAEQIMDLVDYADLVALQGEMLAAINKDEPTVKAEASGKNAEATSGK